MQGLGATQHDILHRHYGILKRLTDNYFKLSVLRTYREGGWEDREPRKRHYKPENIRKLKESISRTRSTVFSLCLCNDFDLFITLTVSAAKCDRYDLEAYAKKLRKWLNNYNSRTGANVQYILIPEQHKDGAWHIHGLIKGLPESHLKLFRKTEDGRTRYTWPAYEAAFGWGSLERIRDKEKCAGYISKYITKQVENTTIKKHDHLYYCSKGLKRGEVVYKGEIRQAITPDYESEYAQVKRYHSLEAALQPFCDANEPTPPDTKQGGANYKGEESNDRREETPGNVQAGCHAPTAHSKPSGNEIHHAPHKLLESALQCLRADTGRNRPLLA
jgi:hypothetical protein